MIPYDSGGITTVLHEVAPQCKTERKPPFETVEDVIPDSVTLANGTFWECSALTTLPENFYVGENVTDLGNIFSLCYNLTD